MSSQDAAEHDTTWDDYPTPKEHDTDGYLGRTGLPERTGPLRNTGAIVRPGEYKPPCKGKGPLNLDMHDALYRDCTPPDLGKVNSEPVVARPQP